MSKKSIKKYNSITIFAGSVAILQGVMLFVGMRYNIAPFISLVKGSIGMNPQTAICFIFAGISIIILSLYRPHSGNITAGGKTKKLSDISFYFFTLLIILIGLLRFIEYLTGIPLSLAHLVSDEWVRKNIMAPSTAFNFIVVGTSLILLKRRSSLSTAIAQSIVLLSGFLALLILIGHTYSLFSFNLLNVFLPPMALNTAILFIIVSIGILCISPDDGFMSYITSSTNIGYTTRRIIPVAIIGPVILGWLRLYGEKNGYYDTATGIAIYTWLMICIFFSFAIFSSRRFIREDRIKKISEIKIAESELLFRTIIDNSPVAITMKDLEGRYIMINKEVERILGISFEELKEKTVYDIHPYDKANIVNENDKAVRETGRVMEYEESVNLNGTLHTFLSQKFPMFDVNNKMYATCGISTDITLRKKSEEKQAALALIVDSSEDAIISKTLDGIITSWNYGAEKLLGYSNEEALGSHVSILIPENHLNEEPEIMERIKRGENIEHFETERIKKDGTIIDISLMISAIKDSKGNIIGASIIARDITEKKLAEKELHYINNQLYESNKELESFSYSVSHDLRAPLRHIIGFGEKLSKASSGKMGDEEKRLMGRITASAGKMALLIDDLLMFSKVGRTEIEAGNVDMDYLFEQVIEEQKQDEDNNNIVWNIQKIHNVKGDPMQLGLVVSNLISNAVKYTGKNTNRKISVGSYKEGEEIVFYVKDNGAGFDMKYSDKLFGVFQRLHKDDEYSGTGIGLATVRRVINRHGGRTWAEGEPGKGASFYFALPGRSFNN